MAKSDLIAAKSGKNDEFYTRLFDIENELKYYKNHFRDKVVYCNCDDARISNFVRYFLMNFESLGLKRLIATGYKADGHGVMFDYDGNGTIDINDISVKDMSGDGDFRSVESVELLKDADIVVTNPPFSLFREFIIKLVECGKTFLLIGNLNAMTYKEVFPLIKNDKLWLGVSCFNRGMYFHVPDDYEYAETYKFDRLKDGKKSMRVSSVCWFTNMSHQKRHEMLMLYKKYDSETYPKYDNYDGIDISTVSDIPFDYSGVMGVPITFLDKYCPEQFEIIKFRKGDDDKDLSVDGKCPYFRILIRNRHPRV